MDWELIFSCMIQLLLINLSSFCFPIRGAMSQAGSAAAQAQEPEQRVEIVEESHIRLGGPTFKNIKPKTYQILEEEMQAGRLVRNSPPTEGFFFSRSNKIYFYQKHVGLINANLSINLKRSPVNRLIKRYKLVTYRCIRLFIYVIV